MDEELVEKVALAIAKAEPSHYLRPWHKNKARAAIQAMMDAGWKSADEVRKIWDAAEREGAKAGLCDY